MPSPRVAFGALSVPSHAATRCYQRATFRALTLEQHAADGWRRLLGGGEVLLRYVMSNPATPAEAAALRSENQTHRDLDALPVLHRESACAEKIFVWLSLASRTCVQQAAHAAHVARDLRCANAAHAPRMLCTRRARARLSTDKLPDTHSPHALGTPCPPHALPCPGQP